MGITDLTFVRAEKIGYGAESRTDSLSRAKLQIAALAGEPLTNAA